MAKYYVESGELRKAVEASSPIRAIARALTLVGVTDEFSDVDLAKVITVNERGYIRDRAYRQHRQGDLVLETGTLLAMIAEHDLV